MALSSNADPGNEQSVQLFHRNAHQQAANAAIATLIGNLTAESRSDAANRILLISGLAGTGKTHLVVNELSKVAPNVFPIIVFSPDRLKEFYPWLDEQIVTSLIKSNRLQELVALLVEAAFAKRTDKWREQLQKDWGENPFRDFVDGMRLAGQSLTIQGINVGVMLGSALPFRTREQRLKKYATELSSALRLGNQRGSVDFCAALLLYQTPYSEAAIQWLSHKNVPEEIGKWNSKTSNFWTFSCIAAALSALNVRVVVCFDQLERIALDQNDRDTFALKQLIQETLKVLFEHRNVACIVSALAAIVDRTMPLLADADRDRVKDEPAPQELRQLPLTDAMNFFAPRLAYIAKSSPDLAARLTETIEWLARHSEVRRVPPRLLLRGAKAFATRFIADSDFHPSNEELWAEIVAPKGEAHDEPLVVGPEEADEAIYRIVAAEWERIQAIGGVGSLLPLPESAVLDLIAWALSNLFHTFPEITGVKDVRVDYKNSTIAFSLTNRGGQTIGSTAYLANEPNNSGRLTKQLERFTVKKGSDRRIVFRSRDMFPLGKKSPVRQLVDGLMSKGFECIDMEKAELMTLLQLRRLESSASATDREVWLRKRLLSLPAVGRLLGVR